MNAEGGILTEVELDREAACRTLLCPNCGVAPTRRCSFGRLPSGQEHRCATSHTGRYLVAVAAGLVPALPGRWHVDELTRERFGPPPLPPPPPAEVVQVAEAERQEERRRVLVEADESPAGRRARAAALARSRRLANAIRTYDVRKSA